MTRSIVMIIGILLSLLLFLQYHLWLRVDGIQHLWQLKKALDQQERQNEELRKSNVATMSHIQYLKNHPCAIELQARSELGLIKKGETFYQIIKQD